MKLKVKNFVEEGDDCEPMRPSLKRSEDTLVVEGRDVERVTVFVKDSCH